jgi:hypothetical protein
MADDVDPEVEVDHQPTDDGELLEVLLAEHRHVGPDCGEELGDHGDHAVEVPGATAAFHRVGERTGDDPRLEALGVHGGRRRCVHGVDAGGGAGVEIVVDRAWIPIEVRRLAELQRVDEDRHHDQIGAFSRCVHE